jgi:hypothetical protein
MTLQHINYFIQSLNPFHGVSYDIYTICRELQNVNYFRTLYSCTKFSTVCMDNCHCHVMLKGIVSQDLEQIQWIPSDRH